VVELPELSADAELILRLHHDEDVTIHVNGQKLLSESGFLSQYKDIPLDASQRALFKPGSNTIAVTCRQTAGGQGVGVGLLLIETETSKEPRTK
jgi:hypothetical protein